MKAKKRKPSIFLKRIERRFHIHLLTTAGALPCFKRHVDRWIKQKERGNDFYFTDSGQCSKPIYLHFTFFSGHKLTKSGRRNPCERISPNKKKEKFRFPIIKCRFIFHTESQLSNGFCSNHHIGRKTNVLKRKMETLILPFLVIGYLMGIHTSPNDILE